MGEAETRVVELDHSLPGGGVEGLDDGLTVPVCLDHELDRRAGERRGEEDDVARIGREPGEATAEELVQALGDGQGLAGGRPGARADELAPQLQREERVARRRLLNTDELRPRQIEADPLSQQVVERPQAQRADRESREPIRRKRAIELHRDGRVGRRPHRREQADTLVTQAAERDLQHTGRRRVEPLEVVEREDDRLPLGEHLEDVEQGQPDGSRVRSNLPGLGQQERDLERAPPQLRERGCHLVEDRCEQVGEPRERQQRLGLHAPVQQDAAEPLLGFLDTCLPQDRLADPRLAGEDERGRAILDAGQKRLDRAELLLAADYLRRHGPRAILAESEPGYESSEATGTATASTIRSNGTSARLLASATAASEAPSNWQKHASSSGTMVEPRYRTCVPSARSSCVTWPSFPSRPTSRSWSRPGR